MSEKVSSGVEIATSILLDDIDRKLRNSGITSFNVGKQFSQTNLYTWHYTSLSYARGISPNHINNEKAFIVVHSLLNSVFKKADAELLINKINAADFTKNKLFPLVVSEYFDNEAFELLKNNKIVLFTIEEMFSKEYTEALKSLISSFIDIMGLLNTDPLAVEKIIKLVAKNEGRINNMKGTFFELLCSQYFHENGSHYIELKKIIDGAEIDLLVDKDNEITIVECKAGNSAINDEKITLWQNKKIPIIWEWLQRAYPNKKVNFQYWSISGFTNEALNLLSKYRPNKFAHSHYGYKEISELKGAPIFKKILTEYFTQIVKN